MHRRELLYPPFSSAAAGGSSKTLKAMQSAISNFPPICPYWRTGYGAEQENHGKALCSGDGQDIRGED